MSELFYHLKIISDAFPDRISRNAFLRKLVDSLYSRTEIELRSGQFRVKGDTVDILLSFEDIQLRVVFWGDEIESIQTVDPESGTVLTDLDGFNIYPANIFVSSKENTARAIDRIAAYTNHSLCEILGISHTVYAADT